MHIVHVHIHIKPEYHHEFRQACIANASNSIQEPGVSRFDVFEQKDDPTRFLLVEEYHSPEDQLKHRETNHYQVWKDIVADMMAEPRYAIIYSAVYPDMDERA